ncbi:hypothetical protein C8R44DRAFT_881084 [Mycena epipterygia]|nr:hypothetical protein C8R44DRAFT_881084 [Mycena epipterygia]
MSEAAVKAVAEKPETFLGIVVFCYSGFLASKFANIHVEILRPLEEVAGKGKITLIRPQVKEIVKAARRGPMGSKADKFPLPIALLARCEDPDARSRCITQVTFGATPTVGFHVVAFDPAHLLWCLGFFRTDIVDPPEVTGRRLAWAVYEGIRGSQTLFSMFDRATQGGSKLSLCITYTNDLEAFIPHANARRGHNLCANCKYDDHPRFNCLFSQRDKAFWGPKGIDEVLADLAGGGDDDGDEGDRRGAPHGRGMTCGYRTRGHQ